MLVWSSTARGVIWSVLALLVGVVYVAPLAIIVMASFAGEWNGVSPSKPTLEHFVGAFTGDSGEQLRHSIITGVLASSFALTVGTWSALALRTLPLVPRRILDLVFFVPSAVPSVSVGLGLLVAFSRPPILLNGTVTIVFIAHFILISAFTYGSVSAGLARLPPDFEQVAESLGARPFYRMLHVTLPLSRQPLRWPSSARAFRAPINRTFEAEREHAELIHDGTTAAHRAAQTRDGGQLAFDG